MGVFIVLCLSLTACAKSTQDAPPTDNTDSVEVDFASTDEEMFTNRDLDDSYDLITCIQVAFNGDQITATSDSVQISGTTITLTEEATYLISGTLDDGILIIDADENAKLQLVLNGVDINSQTMAPLYIRTADKVFITLADGTTNTLSNGGTITSIDDNNIDATLFSKQDLTINGSGTLTIISPSGHGMTCKDDLVTTGGVFSITSASHGIDANDSVRMTGNVQLAIQAGKDGIHVENNEDASLGFLYISQGQLNIEAEGDGVSASASIQIEDGDFEILAGGGNTNGEQENSENWGNFGGRGEELNPIDPHDHSSNRDDAMVRLTANILMTTTEENGSSMKGFKAGSGLLINGGTFNIDSADDALHTNTSMYISAGIFELASGDDALHADESLLTLDGSIHVSTCYEGIEGLTVVIEGGSIDLVATDDGINAAGGVDTSGSAGGRDGMFGGNPTSSNGNGSIQISGGTIQIQASGDGIDANGTLVISGGSTTIIGATQGDTSILDYDTSATITGGTFIGTGASGMTQTFSNSTCGVVTVDVGNQSAGTEIGLYDADGNTILTYTPEEDFKCSF